MNRQSAGQRYRSRALRRPPRGLFYWHQFSSEKKLARRGSAASVFEAGRLFPAEETMVLRMSFSLGLLLLGSCGGGRFEGPLAAWAGAAMTTGDLKCFPTFLDSVAFDGSARLDCTGTIADTIVAVLVGDADTVLVVRRVWGGDVGVRPLMSGFDMFRDQCGYQVALSADGTVRAVFHADTVNGGGSLTFLLSSLNDERGNCESQAH